MRAWGSFARARIFVVVLTIVVFTALPAVAADLTGRVVNGSTGNVAAGDDVILISLSNEGMNETAHTRTDSSGRFSLQIGDPEMTHVVRVVHDGVSYHQVAQPDVHVLAIQVYDVTDKLNDVSAVMDVERFEAAGDRLEVKQLITMRNESKPPRTMMKDRSFEIQLPPEAEVENGLVQVGEEQALKQQPVAGDHPGQYFFVFPMRPGDTRFAVAYRVHYTGKAMIQPVIRNGHERFVVMLPKSMKFEPVDSRVYRPMLEETADNVEGTEPLLPGRTVSFHISGTGALVEFKMRRQEPDSDGQRADGASRLPGGGIGAPIGTPDPLQAYRWRILAGLLGLMVVGATIFTREQNRSHAMAQQSILSNRPNRHAKRRVSLPGKYSQKYRTKSNRRAR